MPTLGTLIDIKGIDGLLVRALAADSGEHVEPGARRQEEGFVK